MRLLQRTGYKILGPDGKPVLGGRGRWDLPIRNEDGTWTPGNWMPATTPNICRSGYHLCPAGAITEWLATAESLNHGGDIEVYLAQGAGRSSSRGGNKRAYSRARLLRRLRWDDEVYRHWATDLIEAVVMPASTEPLGRLVTLLRDEVAGRDRIAALRYELLDAEADKLVATRGTDWLSLELIRIMSRPASASNLFVAYLADYAYTHGLKSLGVEKVATELLVKHLHADD